MKDKWVYSCLYFLFNDIFSTIDKGSLQKGIYSYNLPVYYLVLHDLNVFSEKKTNLGLFYLRQKLTLHFFCGKDINSMRFFFLNLKYDLI